MSITHVLKKSSMVVAGAACIAISIFATEQANAATIDFENLINGFEGNPFTSDGFEFNAFTGGDFPHTELGNSNGTVHTLSHSGGSNGVRSGLTMSKVGNETFSLSGIDVNDISFFNGSATSLSVVGYLFGGGTISKTITLDGLSTFQTETFNSFWSNLTSVEFEGLGGGQDFALDNIVVDEVRTRTSVPEPASVLGLLAFGALTAGSALKQRKSAS